MNVVLEGPDGAGKSTLAALIAGALDMRVQQGSGPPREPGEIEARVVKYLAMTDTIFDRHPAISQPIYAQLRGETLSPDFTAGAVRFYETQPLIVYCRGSASSLAHHVVKDGENPEHIRTVNENYDRLCALYDRWALDHAGVIYRIGDDSSAIVDLVRVLAC